MIVDLAELRLTGKPLDVEVTLTDEELHLSDRVLSLKGPVDSRMRVVLRGDRVVVTGSLACDLVLTCCRCARGTEKRLGKEFSVEYWPDPRVEAGAELELKYEDLDIGFYRNDQLDLSMVISEQIVLEVPMKPICREDCKGLCDQCGADLNEGPCNCPKERVDPRLAVLAELKKKLVH